MKKYLNLLFCLMCWLPVCRAVPYSEDLNQEASNFKLVMQKWADLFNAGKLPGLSTNDHGDVHGYQLTEPVKKDLEDKKLVDKKMLEDVEGHHDPYLIGIETKDNRNYGYFFSIEYGKAIMISAYHWENGWWVKIHGPVP